MGQFLLEKVSGSESKGTEISCKRGVERGLSRSHSLSLAISPLLPFRKADKSCSNRQNNKSSLI